MKTLCAHLIAIICIGTAMINEEYLFISTNSFESAQIHSKQFT